GTVCPRSTGNDNQTCCTDGLGQIPANGDITVPLAVIQAIQASALRALPSTSTSSPVSILSGVGISGNTPISIVTSTAISQSTTMTVIETSTLGAKTPLQSATGIPQAQASPPSSLGLPLGLGLGLAVLLVVGTGVLVLYMQSRARRKALANKQNQGEEFELAGERVLELGEAQTEEMDAAVGRAGRSELSPGMNEETRGMLELEGR
ncbi:hypothetical protein MMC30_009384, partial [Trapelia coarctata]|nr:hypothetical protein [Trapelia coarctata]